MSFSPQALLPVLREPAAARRLRVALSGGLDSVVLLHALHALRQAGALCADLDAIHIHHGLSPDADAWERHCARLCQAIGVPLTGHRVRVSATAGKGIEAAARQARYAALEQEIEPGDCLLMAHHADDQAETLLLQLLRGSGPHGLAAMPALRPFGRGWLARPLLSFGREQLAAWATANALHWVEDPSNRQQTLDRNFLRHTVVAQLRRRWPALAQTLSRSAGLCADAAGLLDALAAIDQQAARTDHPHQLLWPGVAPLSESRRRNLLRHWIAASGFPLPNAKRLERMAVDFWTADVDRNPALAWGGAELHRYRDRLYLIAARPDFDSRLCLAWEPPTALDVAGAGRLSAERRCGSGLSVASLGAGKLEVRFRQGGERCRPSGRSGSHPLKKLFQELAVAPWLRDRIPLIYRQGELIAIADRMICEGFAAASHEPGWVLHWEPPDS